MRLRNVKATIALYSGEELAVLNDALQALPGINGSTAVNTIITYRREITDLYAKLPASMDYSEGWLALLHGLPEKFRVDWVRSLWVMREQVQAALALVPREPSAFSSPEEEDSYTRWNEAVRILARLPFVGELTAFRLLEMRAQVAEYLALPDEEAREAVGKLPSIGPNRAEWVVKDRADVLKAFALADGKE